MQTSAKYFTTMDGIGYFVTTIHWGKDENGNSIALYSSAQKIYVDLNGTKKPNTLGRDVFIFEINFDNNTTVTQCHSYSNDAVNRNCKATGSCCAEKIKRDGWTISHDYPWK